MDWQGRRRLEKAPPPAPGEGPPFLRGRACQTGLWWKAVDGQGCATRRAAGRGPVEENLNPVGRVYSACSVLYCLTTCLSQTGAGLGAQAGEARIRDVARRGGLTRFRRASETPFNLVYEARP
jgi:hypothetical protein